MKKQFIIYHGSQKIIKVPIWGEGNPRNDYGLGFYCTENLDIAKEWACTQENNGYANKYNFDITGLTVLHLSSDKYNILNWLSILLENRIFKISNDIAIEGKKYLLEQFLPQYNDFDVIIGYRANDSYFSFASAFLNNTISLKQLEKAMYLGKLGEQIVLKSKKAFEQIKFSGAIIAKREFYYPMKMVRDNTAREYYKKERTTQRASDAVYLIDILREEWKNNDPRLQRNISK